MERPKRVHQGPNNALARGGALGFVLAVIWMRLVGGNRCAKKTTTCWLRFGGRESLFKISHTNEFIGIGKVAGLPGGACAPLGIGRWVYERAGEKERAQRKGQSVTEPTTLQLQWPQYLCCSTGGLFGFGWAPLRGVLIRTLMSQFKLCCFCVVPYGLPGCRREQQAPPQHRTCPWQNHWQGRHLRRPNKAQGITPTALKGGLCGRLAVRQTYQKATGGTRRLGTLYR